VEAIKNTMAKCSGEDQEKPKIEGLHLCNKNEIN
jgi:hypothetical protein